MNPLPPIPTPPTQRWRQFQSKVLPAVFFLAALTLVVTLWRSTVETPALIGEVEPVRVNVSSPKPGTLTLLRVAHLQQVRAGEPIAQVITTDPKVVQASLGMIKAQIQSLRLSLHPIVEKQRYALNYDRLRLDWMDQRVQLATTQVQLQFAENELRRTEELFRDKVVAQNALDLARTAKQRLEAEVSERTQLVKDQEQKLESLKTVSQAVDSNANAGSDDVLEASILVQESKLRLTESELGPVTLTVPIDGTVSGIQHRSGEAITAGEPILTVSGRVSDRIIGYVPQPLAFAPEVGMKVQVRCRSLPRSVSPAEIVGVGSQLEPINPTFLPLTHAHLHLVGLPILVSLPPDQKLMPGELVDLVVQGGRD